MKLVFSHLGAAKVRHLIPNIERTRMLFPEYEIGLILSKDSKVKRIPDFVTVQIYEPKPDVLSILNRLEHDTKFRGGFWRYSLERIFALEQIHLVSPEAPILHIESDVLLLPNVPLQKISENTKLTWNSYNEDHDVSALLFSPNVESTKMLVEKLRSMITNSPHLTDMTALNLIRKTKVLDVGCFSPIHISLPELENNNAIIDQNQQDGIGYGGIFDGAAIGMWLLGHDPRNNYGKYKIHDDSPIKNGNSWVNPGGINYEITNSGQLLAVSADNPHVKIPIWNLHVHSKNPKLLSKNWERELEYYVALTKNRKEIERFNLVALTQMFLDSILTRTLSRFILGLPFLHKIRRRISPIKVILRKYPKR